MSRKKVREANRELKKQGQNRLHFRPAEPAVSVPILLGITQASLTTESWLSASSFQGNNQSAF